MRSWIVGELGEAAFEQLASGLAGTELQSVLLEVMRRRASARMPSEVLAQYRRDRFVRPSTIDQRVFVELDAHLLAAAEGFEAIELSPLAPLGWVTAKDGSEAPIIDGGAFDWLAKLTSNARSVYVASGMGAQLAAFGFRA